jgi:hypothetical protein
LQRIIINIKVPVGKRIRFDESVDLLHPFDVRIYEKRRWQRNDWDVDWDWDNYFDWETKVDYVMDKDGNLVNPSKPQDQKTENTDDQYRYNDKDQLKKNIQERERRLEEEKRKLEQDKKKLTEDSLRSSAAAKESIDDTQRDATASYELPAFSLGNIFY